MGVFETYKCDNCGIEVKEIKIYGWLKVDPLPHGFSRNFGDFVPGDSLIFCTPKCLNEFFSKYKITYDEGMAVLRKI